MSQLLVHPAVGPVSLRRVGGTAFSVVELLVVVGVIAALIGVTLPLIRSSRDLAVAVRCRSNLREVGMAVSIYAQANRGHVIPFHSEPHERRRRHIAWPELLFGVPAPGVASCPASSDNRPVASAWEDRFTYLMNYWLRSGRIRIDGGNSLKVPASEIVICGENREGGNYEYHPYVSKGRPPWDPQRHGRKLLSNHLWLDLHVSNESPIKRPNARDEWDIPRR